MAASVARPDRGQPCCKYAQHWSARTIWYRSWHLLIKAYVHVPTRTFFCVAAKVLNPDWDALQAELQQRLPPYCR